MYAFTIKHRINMSYAHTKFRTPSRMDRVPLRCLPGYRRTEAFRPATCIAQSNGSVVSDTAARVQGRM